MGLHLENEVAVVKTPTIISNNPIYIYIYIYSLKKWAQILAAFNTAHLNLNIQ